MDEYKRNIKFQYFTISLEKDKSEKRIFSFTEWAVYLKKTSNIMKTIELKGLKARIERIEYDDGNNLWGIRFMKLRDTNIPSTVKENHESVPLELGDDEYIGEDVTMLYDETCGLAMIQSNRFSLYYSRIQELLNKLNPFENCFINILPIAYKTNLSVNKVNSPKKIIMSFANIERPIPKTKSPLSAIINSYYELDGLAGYITIGVGRTKKTVETLVNGKIKKRKEERILDSTTVKDLIEDIYGNGDIITSGKIELRDDDGPNVEIIDLFDNLIHDYLPFTLEKRATLGFEYVINSMKEKYRERKSSILQVLSSK